MSEAAGHLGLGLHLPEGEGQGGQEAQTRDRGGHQVVSDPGVVIITQVASETFLIIHHGKCTSNIHIKSFRVSRLFNR